MNLGKQIHNNINKLLYSKQNIHRIFVLIHRNLIELMQLGIK
jgi:hypothetical protein